MIAILYPLKMDKDLTKAYSSIYEEVIDEKLSKEQQAKYDAHVNQKKKEDSKIKKTGNPAFDDPSHHSFAKNKIKKNIFDDVGKFRSEWEEMKLNEKNDYRTKFDEWIEGIVKEGYDIERWSDEELIDTFIDEKNLWQSREGVESALLESDKKGSGSGKKDACYKKVKASSDVWPSAYASGRLVQCRKKGAANYGKSSKKEDFSNWRDELNLTEG